MFDARLQRVRGAFGIRKHQSPFRIDFAQRTILIVVHDGRTEVLQSQFLRDFGAPAGSGQVDGDRAHHVVLDLHLDRRKGIDGV